MSSLPATCRAVIEVPRGSFVKRELHGAARGGGRVEFVSPVPCPFNYGFVPGLPGLDGDPADAIELGRRLPLGGEVERSVVGVVRFMDAGLRDDKLLLHTGRPGRSQVVMLRGFFKVYAVARRALNRLQGSPGATRYEGVEIL